MVSIAAALAACIAIVVPIVLLKTQNASTATTTIALVINQQTPGTTATQSIGNMSVNTTLTTAGVTCTYQTTQILTIILKHFLLIENNEI